MKLNIQLFAISVETTFSESNVSIENNTSSLTINIYFSPNNDSTWFESKNLYCWVNGVEQYINVKLNKGGSVSASFTFNNIQHNSDGTKNVDWEWYIRTGTNVLGTLNPSGTKSLTTIPRASVPTFSSIPAILGQSVTINTNRYVNTFTHDITYSIGSVSGTIATNVGESTNWTPPLTLANQITSSTTGDCIITCKTYNGNTLIGTKEVVLPLSVPTSVVPSVSIGTLTEAAEAMIALNWGIFVQNKSKLNIPITAAGVYGSTITSIVTTINGLTFNGANVITSTLVTAGTNTISTTITDSRGRTATTTKTYNVVAYSNPSITTAQVQRCLSDGTISEDGTYLLYSFIGSISPVSNHNSKIFKLGYKRTIDDNYTFITLSNDYSINVSDVISSFTINPDYAYDVVFQAIDSFMTTEINKSIYVGFDLLNFNSSGKAMAIGKVSEATANQKLLEIKLPTQFIGDGLLSILNLIYPIGSIYMSINNVSPQSFFGGTWVPIVGSYLYACSSNETGGTTFGSNTTSDSSAANTGSHTLTIDEMPSHTHQLDRGNYGNSRWEEISYSNGSSKATNSNGVHATGGGQGHSHTMAHTHTFNPPSYRVYCWRRTA